MELVDMTEGEIRNFALNFHNLINAKNSEIVALKRENSRLNAIVEGGAVKGQTLSVDQVRDAKRPVWVTRMVPSPHTFGSTPDRHFWALPLKDYSGVISPTKGVYRYDRYGETWVAAFDEEA